MPGGGVITSVVDRRMDLRDGTTAGALIKPPELKIKNKQGLQTSKILLIAFIPRRQTSPPSMLESVQERVVSRADIVPLEGSRVFSLATDESFVGLAMCRSSQRPHACECSVVTV